MTHVIIKDGGLEMRGWHDPLSVGIRDTPIHDLKNFHFWFWDVSTKCWTYMSQGLNSHYFHIIGDGHQPKSVGVYIPILGMSPIPKKTRLLTMAQKCWTYMIQPTTGCIIFLESNHSITSRVYGSSSAFLPQTVHLYLCVWKPLVTKLKILSSFG